MKFKILFLAALYALSLLSDGRACHAPINFNGGRRKRNTADEIQETSILRQYFTACLQDKVGSISGWRSTVDYSILLTNWYRNTDDFTCLGEATASCWKRELEVFVQSGSSSRKILQAGKDCIDEYKADQADGINVYQITSANSRERQTSNSDGSNFLIVGFPDPLLQRYRACVLASSFGLSEIYQQLDITSVSNFVIDHLQYSCDSRDARTSTNQFEVLWPFRFVALTRLDSPLREILLRCGKQLYPPAPFWEDFGKWSDCSATCGGGSQTRKRMCKDGANPRVISNGCIGEGIEKRSCNTTPCPGNHEWGEWSDWKTCTSVFQCYGQQTRTRICLQEIETV
ncbi:unnamed protein product [Clavelina lepadiformis]|uniref:Uncharacterized protein n=1 Tax=Clavelina lepadiformis TaxID=159417 RepID=A0ABP0FFP8_CLALP